MADGAFVTRPLDLLQHFLALVESIRRGKPLGSAELTRAVETPRLGELLITQVDERLDGDVLLEDLLPGFDVPRCAADDDIAEKGAHGIGDAGMVHVAGVGPEALGHAVFGGGGSGVFEGREGEAEAVFVADAFDLEDVDYWDVVDDGAGLDVRVGVGELAGVEGEDGGSEGGVVAELADHHCVEGCGGSSGGILVWH